MGMTHIRLVLATEDILAGALLAAYNLRREKNRSSSRSKKSPQSRH